MKAVDLHVHSSISDGTFTPTQLVEYALTKELRSFSLTDHDTIDGLEEAISYGNQNNMEVIAGIELSTRYLERDIHILGLCIDYQNTDFLTALASFQQSRHHRNIEMCEKLQKKGIEITYPLLIKMFPNAIITRAHYASFLHQKSYVTSIVQAFEQYIGDHAPCFVPRKKITPAEGISLIKKAGGIPILAHPTLYHLSDNVLDDLVKKLTSEGLVGIEAVYSTHSPSQERQIKSLAAKYQLCISGGSDFHGKNKEKIDLAVGFGKLFVPETILDDLIMRKPFTF